MPEVGKVELYVLCRETNSRLDALARSVQECKCLDEASEFCRFVRWSGLIKLFKSNPQPFPLAVDGYLLEGKLNELLREVQDRFKSGKVQPKIDVAELQRINHKLDLIAGQISRFVPAPPPAFTPVAVMQGGADVGS